MLRLAQDCRLRTLGVVAQEGEPQGPGVHGEYRTQVRAELSEARTVYLTGAFALAAPFTSEVLRRSCLAEYKCLWLLGVSDI